MTRHMRNASGRTTTFWPLVRHEIRRVRQTAVPRLIFLVLPFVFIACAQHGFDLIFSLRGRPQANGAEQVVPGMATLFGLVNLIFFGYTAFGEWGNGTWHRLQTYGATPRRILSAKALVCFLYELLVLLVIVGLGGWIFELRVAGSTLALLCSLVVLAAVISAFGWFVYTLSPSNAIFNVVAYAGSLLLTALAGGLTLNEFLPTWATSIQRFTPIYWPLRALKRVIDEPIGLEALQTEFGLSATLVAFFVTISLTIALNRRREAFSL